MLSYLFSSMACQSLRLSQGINEAFHRQVAKNARNYLPVRPFSVPSVTPW